jgi:energy-coupling factor transporter ATP-binding protein EcfA2
MEEGPAPSGAAWEPKEYVIPVQVFAEVTLGPKPLTREEFRKICDRYRTKDEILSALSRGSWQKGGIAPTLILIAIVLLLLTLSVGYVIVRRRRTA